MEAISSAVPSATYLHLARRQQVTFALGEIVDGSVIFGVVFVLGLIGYIQETKAEDAIRALTKMLVTEATVRREGRKQRVRSIKLVPGDVVLLQSGDASRLICASSFCES